jgi:hypothetical protein
MQVHTHLEQAQHIRGKLTEELQALKLLEEELKGHAAQDLRKRVRLDRMSVAIGYLQKCVDELGEGRALMLRDPLHNAGADGLCEECGEPFPCPPGLAYIVGVVDADVVPEEIHLALTRDEFTTMLEALRAQGLPDFADRLEGASLEPEEVESNRPEQ